MTILQIVRAKKNAHFTTDQFNPKKRGGSKDRSIAAEPEILGRRLVAAVPHAIHHPEERLLQAAKDAAAESERLLQEDIKR